MRFDEKLQRYSKDQIWQEYCGFLDMTPAQYMVVQHRLLKEQLSLWCPSGLGQHLLKGQTPGDIRALKDCLPLTTYEDYADVLLTRDAAVLPGKPVVWIETTWEGGIRPVKVAPYTAGMIEAYRRNLCSVAILCTSREKGTFLTARGDRVLYGGAPLPYATGLIPSVLDEDIAYEWLPDSNNTAESSFSGRVKQGFKLGLNGGIDLFFSMGAVANSITGAFSAMAGSSGSSGGGGAHVSPGTALRFLKAKGTCRREKRGLLPKDIFRLKGLVYTGPDSRCYRESLTEAWGVTPHEIMAGTESTLIASETWQRKGMVFFPNACFYEFIPRAEMLRCDADGAKPRTCLMDEVRAGENYELVISVLHGGAFMRYRTGDMYRCISASPTELPRFLFTDRVPSVIDIAGFTRMTEASVSEVLRISRVPVSGWLMNKEYDAGGTPFLHMYVEVDGGEYTAAATEQLLADHLSAYFRYFDSDYADLKKLLAVEPLKITILRTGLMRVWEEKNGRKLTRINTDPLDIAELMDMALRDQ